MTMQIKQLSTGKLIEYEVLGITTRNFWRVVNLKWDFGTFEQLRKSYNSKKATIQAIKALCLLVRSRQLDPATLPFAQMVM